MTYVLKRLSTEYDIDEDRVRLSGETESGETVVLWITLRLLKRLIPKLLERLKRQDAEAAHAEVLQEFAQQAARAEIAPQAPVKTNSASKQWLVHSVVVSPQAKSLILTFKSADDDKAKFRLTDVMLRQWLNFVYFAYLKAEWPIDLWPEWIKASAAPKQQQRLTVH